MKIRRQPSNGAFSTSRSMLPLVVIAVLLFALPVIMLVIGAFRNAPPGQAAQWSFDAFGRTLANPATYSTFADSVVIAVVCAACSVILALVLVFFAVRSTAPLRRIVTPVTVLVLALPPLFYAMSWGMLWNPRLSYVNQWWMSVTGGEEPLFSAYSWPGLVSVMILKGTSFCYLLLLGPFRAMDRSLEEAAQMSGASRLRTIFNIDLAVLLPAISGVVILNLIIGLEAFEVPLFLGTPAGIDVFSTEIYGYISDQTPADYGGASVLSLLLVGLVLLMVALQWVMLGGKRYTTVTGKSYNTTPWEIGAWRWVGTAVIALYVLFGVVLPIAQLVLGSLQPFFGGGVYALTNYEALLSDPMTVEAIRSTIIVAIVGGLAAVALAFLTMYAVTHNETWMRRVVEMLTWLPFTLPGIVLALGLSWTYVSIPGLRQLYGSMILVGLGLVIAAVPIATRAIQPALMQINRELEEASRISGARPMRVVLGVVLPLIAPSFFSAWFVVAIVIAGNLSIPVLLSSALTPTVPLLVYDLNTQGYASRAAALLVLLLGTLTIGMLLLLALQRLVTVALRRLRTGASSRQGHSVEEPSADPVRTGSAERALGQHPSDAPTNKR
ncbi:ABC transporter permease [Microbacterium halotolerans]|uniref:ABC transporter permease n=1 Tax=Microbacterium halotolerans TaxID=246613 RepID=UPI000E6AB541|nr:iron ABC transporter permease [Microbacterium halotolerans]